MFGIRGGAGGGRYYPHSDYKPCLKVYEIDYFGFLFAISTAPVHKAILFIQLQPLLLACSAIFATLVYLHALFVHISPRNLSNFRLLSP